MASQHSHTHVYIYADQYNETLGHANSNCYEYADMYTDKDHCDGKDANPFAYTDTNLHAVAVTHSHTNRNADTVTDKYSDFWI
jgi:hypothetical protein